MKKLFEKACVYQPNKVVEFLMELWAELPLEQKAIFKAIMIRYWLNDRLDYYDDYKPSNEAKKPYYEDKEGE